MTESIEQPKKTARKAPAKKAITETMWEAIIRARGLVEPIVKDSHCSIGGGGYNYLSTETVLRECVPILSQCGLVLMPGHQKFTFARDGESVTPIMEIEFMLWHSPSDEGMVINHSLPIENMRTPTKGSLAVRTTAFQYAIRDLLALPRVEERQAEVDNPDGKQQTKKSKARPATEEQMQYLREQMAGAPDPDAFFESLNTRLESRYGVTMETLTTDVAAVVIRQFENKKEAAK